MIVRLKGSNDVNCAWSYICQCEARSERKRIHTLAMPITVSWRMTALSRFRSDCLCLSLSRRTRTGFKGLNSIFLVEISIHSGLWHMSIVAETSLHFFYHNEIIYSSDAYSSGDTGRGLRMNWGRQRVSCRGEGLIIGSHLKE